jgi:hypothetical protein
MIVVGDKVVVTGYPVNYPWLQGLVGEVAEVMEVASGCYRISADNFPMVWIGRAFIELAPPEELAIEAESKAG